MQRTQLHFVADFRVALSNRRAQVAEMMIAPGDAEGGPNNRHVGADQWLFVQSGTGIAYVSGKQIRLRRGTVLLIERSEPHEIRNTGRTRCARSTSTRRRRMTLRGSRCPAVDQRPERPFALSQC